MSRDQWELEEDPLDEAERILANHLSTTTTATAPATGPRVSSYVKADHVLAVVNKHLDVLDQEGIEVILATAIAINLPGDPSWLHVVAPSGGGKTEILRAFNGDRVVSLSTITPQTLISGLRHGGSYADLMPRLDKKLLIIKDFGSVLSLHPERQRGVYADLREAYDGKLEKAYGSGVGIKSFEAVFGLISGVTDAIDQYRLVHAQLGERFLRVNIQGDDEKAVARALGTHNGETAMRQELYTIMRMFLDHSIEWVDANKYPEQQHIQGLQALAIITARLRSPVARDRQHQILYRPHPEVGTRLAKQLRRLIIGLANIRDTICTTHRDYFTTRRVALSTVPQYRLDIIEALLAADVLNRGSLTTEAIRSITEMAPRTAPEKLEDMWQLKLITREGAGALTWGLTNESRDLLKRASIDASLETIQKVNQWHQ
jgi:hypothetical protein